MSGYAPSQGMMIAPAASAPDGNNTFDPAGKYKIKCHGAYMACEVALAPGDDLKAEGGAMVSMSSNTKINTHIEGSCFTACCRCCCADEGLFFSDFTSNDGQPADVLVAPKVPGEIILIQMDGSCEWKIQKGSYMCCDPSIEIGFAIQGCCQGLGSGEGFIILKATGTGRLVLNSYGSIIRYDLQPGERRTIDNGALVAWTGYTEYSIGMAKEGGGFFSKAVKSLVSGEGLVTRFTGPGTVFVQTRSIFPMALTLYKHLPESKKPQKN